MGSQVSLELKFWTVKDEENAWLVCAVDAAHALGLAYQELRYELQLDSEDAYKALTIELNEEAAKLMSTHWFKGGFHESDIGDTARVLQYNGKDLEFIRACGFQSHEGGTCGCCGLSDFEQEEWAVCYDCNNCVECGCECEYDEVDPGVTIEEVSVPGVANVNIGVDEVAVIGTRQPITIAEEEDRRILAEQDRRINLLADGGDIELDEDGRPKLIDGRVPMKRKLEARMKEIFSSFDYASLEARIIERQAAEYGLVRMDDEPIAAFAQRFMDYLNPYTRGGLCLPVNADVKKGQMLTMSPDGTVGPTHIGVAQDSANKGETVPVLVSALVGLDGRPNRNGDIIDPRGLTGRILDAPYGSNIEDVLLKEGRLPTGVRHVDKLFEQGLQVFVDPAVPPDRCVAAQKTTKGWAFSEIVGMAIVNPMVLDPPTAKKVSWVRGEVEYRCLWPNEPMKEGDLVYCAPWKTWAPVPSGHFGNRCGAWIIRRQVRFAPGDSRIVDPGEASRPGDGVAIIDGQPRYTRHWDPYEEHRLWLAAREMEEKVDDGAVDLTRVEVEVGCDDQSGDEFELSPAELREARRRLNL